LNPFIAVEDDFKATDYVVSIDRLSISTFSGSSIACYQFRSYKELSLINKINAKKSISSISMSNEYIFCCIKNKVLIYSIMSDTVREISSNNPLSSGVCSFFNDNRLIVQFYQVFSNHIVFIGEGPLKDIKTNTKSDIVNVIIDYPYAAIFHQTNVEFLALVAQINETCPYPMKFKKQQSIPFQDHSLMISNENILYIIQYQSPLIHIGILQQQGHINEAINLCLSIPNGTEEILKDLYKVSFFTLFNFFTL